MIPTPSGGGPDGVREETSLGPRGCPDVPQVTLSNNDIDPFRTRKMISERERVIMRSLEPFRSPFGSIMGPFMGHYGVGSGQGTIMVLACHVPVS